MAHGGAPNLLIVPGQLPGCTTVTNQDQSGGKWTMEEASQVRKERSLGTDSHSWSKYASLNPTLKVIQLEKIREEMFPMVFAGQGSALGSEGLYCC